MHGAFAVCSYWLVIAIVLATPVGACEPSVRIAVAANFYTTAERLVSDFQSTNNLSIELVSGSSGKHFAQLIHGAPFDLFLSADQDKPARLYRQSLTASAPITYARGRIALLYPAKLGAAPLANIQAQVNFRVAIANPRLAPYGVAAAQLLDHWQLNTQAQRITADNVAQAMQMVVSGNAAFGLVGWSQVMAFDLPPGIGTWLPDQSSYQPILQDAVLMKRAANNDNAQLFFSYLTSARAGSIVRDAGYLGVEQR